MDRVCHYTDLATEITLAVHVDVLSVLAVHTAGQFLLLAVRVQHKLQLGQAVEQLGQMASHLYTRQD